MLNSIQKKKDNKVVFICWLAYTVAYIGRLNFSASIVAVVAEMGITKSQAGLVSSFFFFAYGIGQLVNGILSKRYNNKVMIFFSLITSSLLNFLMPLFCNIDIMKYIWLLNGAVQSILWCTLIKTISEKVSDKSMSSAIVVMSTTTPIGTFIAYGLSSLYIKIASWKAVFYTASVLLAVTAFIWLFMYGEKKIADVEDNDKTGNAKTKIGKPIIAVLIITAFAGIANGFVKDGVTTWVSPLLYEEFYVSKSFSVLLTLLLPLVATLGATVVRKIHKTVKSHTSMNTLFFSLASVFCGGILIALRIRNFALIMLCFMAVAFLMAMINNVITSVFPLDYRKELNAGFLAGLLNTFCYIGSTVTSYALGSVAQNKGWIITFLLMLFVCVFATIISSFGFIFGKNTSHKNQ